MRKIGYARVSSPSQNLDRQLSALRAEGCDLIFREKASARSLKERPQLHKAIDQLGEGDIFIVAEWDRATRSMMDGIALIDRVNSRGAMLKVLDRPYLDLTTAVGRGLMAFLSALAEDERNRILKRCAEGRMEARKQGIHLGRKPKLTDHQMQEALERLSKGESCRAIGRSMNVHHATISRLHSVL